MPFDGTTISPEVRLLIEGRDKIEAGWAQGAFHLVDIHSHEVRVCALGAIGYPGEMYELPEEERRRDLAKAILIKCLGCHGALGVQVWNDHQARTKEEVLALYEAAIELAMAQA